MLVGAAFVGIRLAPLSLRHGVAWGTLWPLAAAALATVFEAALLVGTPIGFASAHADASARKPTESAGSSVAETIRSRACLGFAILWFVVTAGIGAYANLWLGAPARVARGVVRGAREICEEHAGHGSVAVPIIGARWVCSPTAPPRLFGELSKQGTTTKYSASAIDVSEDLSVMDLSDLDISSPAVRGRPLLHLTVHAARLRGAWPWAKKKRIPGFGRAVYVAALGSLLGLVAAVVTLRRAGSRLTVSIVAALGGGAAWMLLGSVDAHENWAIGSYALVPLGALLVMSLAWILLGRLKLEQRLASCAAEWSRRRAILSRKPD
jgi:hypothetical protein